MDHSEYVTAATRGFTEGFLNHVSQALGDKKEQVRRIFTSTFGNYLEQEYERNRKKKTIIHRRDAKDIDSFYVPLKVDYNNDRISTDNLDRLLGISSRLILTGEAGIGKSTLSQKLFMDLADSADYGVPVYIKLRRLGEGESIKDRALDKLTRHNSNFTNQYFDKCLQRGRLTLMLDGYDEIKQDVRPRIESEILDVSRRYSSTRILVFGRPASDFQGWDEFTTLDVCSLCKDDAIMLVDKIDVDSDIKEDFTEELRGSLFRTHRDFLSNPLLLTLMLMTYEKNAEIPSQMHVFYDRAFTVLYSEHDATKGAFNRPMHTDLTFSDFRNSLSAFCFVCDVKSKSSFSRGEAISYLDYASDMVDINFDSSNFLNDLSESLCLLLQEDLEYTFAHKSFLEYFSARFLNRWTSDERASVMKRLFGSEFYSNTLNLLIEINNELLLRDYFLPAYKSILDNLRKTASEKGKYASLCKIFGSITLNIRYGFISAVRFTHVEVDGWTPFVIINQSIRYLPPNLGSITPFGGNKQYVSNNRLESFLEDRYEDRFEEIKPISEIPTDEVRKYTNDESITRIHLERDQEIVTRIFDIDGLYKNYISILVDSLDYAKEKIEGTDESILEIVD